jgi:hypothetical protein
MDRRNRLIALDVPEWRLIVNYPNFGSDFGCFFSSFLTIIEEDLESLANPEEMGDLSGKHKGCLDICSFGVVPAGVRDYTSLLLVFAEAGLGLASENGSGERKAV